MPPKKGKHRPRELLKLGEDGQLLECGAWVLGKGWLPWAAACAGPPGRAFHCFILAPAAPCRALQPAASGPASCCAAASARTHSTPSALATVSLPCRSQSRVLLPLLLPACAPAVPAPPPSRASSQTAATCPLHAPPCSWLRGRAGRPQPMEVLALCRSQGLPPPHLQGGRMRSRHASALHPPAGALLPLLHCNLCM